MKLGIDLGGSKIEIIALDEQGVELLRRRVPTPQGDYSATLHAIENLNNCLQRPVIAATDR
jgi:fructokinase